MLNKSAPRTEIMPTDFSTLDQALRAIEAEARAVANTSTALHLVIIYPTPGSADPVRVQGVVEQRPHAFPTAPPVEGEKPRVVAVPADG